MYFYIITFALLFFTIAGFFRGVWWFSLLDFFRLQYAILAFFMILLGLSLGHFVAALLCFGIVALNFYRMRKFIPKISKSHSSHEKTIVSVNAHEKNGSPEKLEALIIEANPHVLLVMEMTDDIEEALKEALSHYEYKLSNPVRDGFRIVLYSKTPLIHDQVTFYGPDDTPLLQAQTEINGCLYQIYSAHPKPALNKKWYRERHDYFSEIEKVITQEGLPTLVMGDFNSVPWETHFLQFLSNTGLKSSLSGHGYKITWPVYVPILGVPMDHILLSKDIEYSGLRVGPYVGSDHHPISLSL